MNHLISILFRYGVPSNVVLLPMLQELAVVLKTNAQISVEVQGYTDNAGSPEHNKVLNSKYAYVGEAAHPPSPAAAFIATAEQQHGIT